MIICLLYSYGMQCKKRYDQGLSMRKKHPIREVFLFLRAQIAHVENKFKDFNKINYVS